MENKRITLDGQTLHGSDQYGTWRTHKVTGWDQTPPQKSNDEEREGTDGDFDVDAHYGARTITLNGRLSAINESQAREARRRLTGILHQRGQLLIEDGTIPLWATVKRGNIEPGAIRGRWLIWQMELRAPNPRKFGDTNTFVTPQDAYKTVFHYGNYQAIPVFTIQGVMPGGYRIYGPAGEVFTVTAALNGTDVIDFADGTVTRNGTTVLQGAVGQWGVWTVGPGANSSFMVQPVTTGTATITAKVKDTFI